MIASVIEGGLVVLTLFESRNARAPRPASSESRRLGPDETSPDVTNHEPRTTKYDRREKDESLPVSG